MPTRLNCWIGSSNAVPIPGSIFLNHGEDDARAELKKLIAKRGVDEAKIFLPTLDERFELTAGSPASKGRAASRIAMTQVTRDWQNEHAALLIALGERLRTIEDPDEKKALLQKLNSALES